MPISIGKRIKQIRLEKGLTQNELAEAAGVTMAAVSRYELGQRVPRPKVIVAIANALGVSPFSLASVPAEQRQYFEKLDHKLNYMMNKADEQDDSEKKERVREMKSAADEVMLDVLDSFLSVPTEEAITDAQEALSALEFKAEKERLRRTTIRSEAKKRRQVEQLTSIFSELSRENRLKVIDYANTLKMAENYERLQAPKDEPDTEE